MTFGLWSGYEGVDFVDRINAYARANNVHIFALPGNHENYDWWNATIETCRKSQQTSRGFAYLRTHVLLAPRVHRWTWAGKQFAVVGGAVSIDKDYRIEYERKKDKKIWWPQEQLTDEELETVKSWGSPPIDYLFTHDCSNRTPWRHRLKPDLDSQMHRQKIDVVLSHLKPKTHLHGHMHERYEWENLVGDDVYTQTYGLECNDDPDSWGVLDTATGEFTFATDM